MTVRPVMNYGIRGNYNMNFAGKRYENQTSSDNNSSYSKSAGITKAVPLAVLLAMSPLNAGSAASERLVPGQNVVELVVPQFDNDVKKLGQRDIDSGRQSCRFIRESTDGNNSNTEMMLFNYLYKLNNKGSQGLISGAFLAICTTKTADNKYIAVYRELLKSKDPKKLRLCLLPEEFGRYLVQFAQSSDNNKAVLIGDRAEFVKTFEANAVANAQPIEKQIYRIRDSQNFEAILSIPIDVNKFY